MSLLTRRHLLRCDGGAEQTDRSALHDDMRSRERMSLLRASVRATNTTRVEPRAFELDIVRAHQSHQAPQVVHNNSLLWTIQFRLQTNCNADVHEQNALVAGFAAHKTDSAGPKEQQQHTAAAAADECVSIEVSRVVFVLDK